MNGDLTVLADATLENLNITGTLYVNPGQNGTVTLNNVTAPNIVILSGGTASIYLNNVTATNLTVQDDDSIRIESKGATAITNTFVHSGAILEATAGSFGAIELAPTSTAPVELRGNFAGSTITVPANVAVGTLVVASGSAGIVVRNEGEIQNLDANEGMSVVGDTPGTITGSSSDSVIVAEDEEELDELAGLAAKEAYLQALVNAETAGVLITGDIKVNEETAATEDYTTATKEINKAVATLVLKDATLTNDTEGNLVLKVSATGTEGLVSLEVDHSLGKPQQDPAIVPEFTVTVEDVPASEETMGAGFTFENGTWTMSFGELISKTIRENTDGNMTFHFVIKDGNGNQFGSMDGNHSAFNLGKVELEVPETPGAAELEAAVLAAGAYDVSGYTTESFGALTDALALDENTTEKIAAKTTAINDAIEGLVEQGEDKTALQLQANKDLIFKISGIKRGNAEARLTLDELKTAFKDAAEEDLTAIAQLQIDGDGLDSSTSVEDQVEALRNIVIGTEGIKVDANGVLTIPELYTGIFSEEDFAVVKTRDSVDHPYYISVYYADNAGGPASANRLARIKITTEGVTFTNTNSDAINKDLIQ